RSSAQTAAEPRPGKCFTRAAPPRPSANATAYPDDANCRDPSGPSGASSTGARSTSTPAPRSATAVALPAACASAGLVQADAGRHGGSEGNDLTRPPSWSAKTSAPRGRGRSRSHVRTITPPPPRGAGSPETTTSAAFSYGVMGGSAATAAYPAAP